MCCWRTDGEMKHGRYWAVIALPSQTNEMDVSCTRGRTVVEFVIFRANHPHLGVSRRVCHVNRNLLHYKIARMYSCQHLSNTWILHNVFVGIIMYTILLQFDDCTVVVCSIHISTYLSKELHEVVLLVYCVHQIYMLLFDLCEAACF